MAHRNDDAIRGGSPPMEVGGPPPWIGVGGPPPIGVGGPPPWIGVGGPPPIGVGGPPSIGVGGPPPIGVGGPPSIGVGGPPPIGFGGPPPMGFGWPPPMGFGGPPPPMGVGGPPPMGFGWPSPPMWFGWPPPPMGVGGPPPMGVSGPPPPPMGVGRPPPPMGFGWQPVGGPPPPVGGFGGQGIPTLPFDFRLPPGFNPSIAPPVPPTPHGGSAIAPSSGTPFPPPNMPFPPQSNFGPGRPIGAGGRARPPPMGDRLSPFQRSPSPLDLPDLARSVASAIRRGTPTSTRSDILLFHNIEDREYTLSQTELLTVGALKVHFQIPGDDGEVALGLQMCYDPASKWKVSSMYDSLTIEAAIQHYYVRYPGEDGDFAVPELVIDQRETFAGTLHGGADSPADEYSDEDMDY
ncbi:hypothetical protein LTR08_004368 [Meristemomyces frigidus]|nr:hypothetical protein LTR08_004368 [Meristemomyces frigidus]